MKKPFLYIQLLFWVISSPPELVVVQIKTQGFLKHSFICTARPTALTQDNHVISLTAFSSSTNPKWPVIVAFLSSVDGKLLMLFQNEISVFKFLRVVSTGRNNPSVILNGVFHKQVIFSGKVKRLKKYNCFLRERILSGAFLANLQRQMCRVKANPIYMKKLSWYATSSFHFTKLKYERPNRPKHDFF